MAWDDYREDFHLSPRKGWVIGKPPADRVLTLERHIFQASGFSREETTWSEKWRSRKITEKELAKLRKKFPRPGETD